MMQSFIHRSIGRLYLQWCIIWYALLKICLDRYKSPSTFYYFTFFCYHLLLYLLASYTACQICNHFPPSILVPHHRWHDLWTTQHYRYNISKQAFSALEKVLQSFQAHAPIFVWPQHISAFFLCLCSYLKYCKLSRPSLMHW